MGEVLRRIVGKAVMSLVQRDMVSATAPTQVCAGLPGGVEAAVHAVREIYDYSKPQLQLYRPTQEGDSAATEIRRAWYPKYARDS